MEWVVAVSVIAHEAFPDLGRGFPVSTVQANPKTIKRLEENGWEEPSATPYRPLSVIYHHNKTLANRPTTQQQHAAMHLIFLPILLVGALTVTAKELGYWTLRGFEHICTSDSSACLVRLVVLENPNGNMDPDPNDPGTTCMFVIYPEAGKPAADSGWNDSRCSDESPQYRINGGWSDMGFITVVVTNKVEDANAFFSYGKDAIAAGAYQPDQSRLAYKIGTFGENDMVVEGIQTTERIAEGGYVNSEVEARQDRGYLVVDDKGEPDGASRRSRIMPRL
jgi:hypothetical protein